MVLHSVTSPVRRLALVHRSGFRYSRPVAASYNEARMTPASGRRQTTIGSRVRVEPVTWTHSYRDYWGTQVLAFDVLVPHEALTVVSTSTVEVYPEAPPAEEAGWDALAGNAVLDAHHEFLVQTPVTEPDPEVVEIAKETAAGLTPSAAARAVSERLHSMLEYRTGVTSVRTAATEVWRQRSGVCQDFAHLTIGALRELGIPARYVSGYLHPEPDAPPGLTVEGQGHAWIEWWCGSWTGYDPTHAAGVSGDHVVVARGREYADVTPLKGVYSGGSGSELFVSVEVTRLG